MKVMIKQTYVYEVEMTPERLKAFREDNKTGGLDGLDYARDKGEVQSFNVTYLAKPETTQAPHHESNGQGCG